MGNRLKAVKYSGAHNEKFNVLVPKDAKKEFYNKGSIKDLTLVAKKLAPQLYKITDKQLEDLSDPTYQDALNLYHLNQLSHGSDYDMQWSLMSKDTSTKKNIDKIVDLLGLPKANAVYVNKYTGTTYYTFDELKKDERLWFRYVLDHKPIVDEQWEFEKHNKSIQELELKQSKLLNPKTKKPTTKNQTQYASLDRLIRERKSAIKQLENLTNKKSKPLNKMSDKKPTVKIGDDEFDCDDLAERERKQLANRRKTTAKSSKKRESTKNVEKVEKATDLVEKSIEKRKDQGKTVSLTEVETMIGSTKGLIRKLEGLLKKAS